jgi:hypothetical protein
MSMPLFLPDEKALQFCSIYLPIKYGYVNPQIFQILMGIKKPKLKLDCFHKENDAKSHAKSHQNISRNLTR